jgi:hypothetical protein
VEKLEAARVDATDAKAFASTAGLHPQTLAYIDAKQVQKPGKTRDKPRIQEDPLDRILDY